MNSHYTNNNNNINNNNNNNNIGGIPDKQSSNSAAARKDGKEEARFDAVFCRRLARILWLCVTRTISPNTRQAAAPPPKKRKGKKLLEASNSSFSSSLSFLISYIPLLYLLLLLSSGLTEVLVWFNGLSISEFYLCLNTRDYPAFQSLVIKVTVIYIAISISKALLHYFGGLFSVATRTRLTIQ